MSNPDEFSNPLKVSDVLGHGKLKESANSNWTQLWWSTPGGALQLRQSCWAAPGGKSCFWSCRLKNPEKDITHPFYGPKTKGLSYISIHLNKPKLNSLNNLVLVGKLGTLHSPRAKAKIMLYFAMKENCLNHCWYGACVHPNVFKCWRTDPNAWPIEVSRWFTHSGMRCGACTGVCWKAVIFKIFARL